MKAATHYFKTAIVKKSVMALLAVGVIACNGNDKGGLKVAGGTIDGSTGSTLFPSTMYVVMDGTDFGDQPRTISNVGTFVDVGIPDKIALVMSLKDIFVNVNGRAALPIFKKVNITIYPSTSETINLPGISFQQDGSLKQDGTNRGFALVSVGLKVQKVGSSSIPDDKAAAVISKVFYEDPLMAGSLNLRDPQSSYQMMLFPRSAHAYFQNLKAPQLVVADNRGPESGLKDLKLVGFGENIVGGDRKTDFSLASSLPTIMKRNYADIKPLNTGAADQTPVRKLTSANPQAMQQIWEILGSGLCGSKDGNNYDTGAAVYSGTNQFLGFAVASTTKGNFFKGKLDCAATGREDMASVIVSPSAAAVGKLLQLQSFVQ